MIFFTRIKFETTPYSFDVEVVWGGRKKKIFGRGYVF